MIAYAKQIGVDTVVLLSRFSRYIDGNGFNNEEGGKDFSEQFPYDNIGQQEGTFPYKIGAWNTGTRKLRVEKGIIRELQKLLIDFNVVVIKPIPEAGWNVPKLLLRGSMYNQQVPNLTSYNV